VGHVQRIETQLHHITGGFAGGGVEAQQMLEGRLIAHDSHRERPGGEEEVFRGKELWHRLGLL
jgi:hypothetical protein